jgi:hypothetical protein
MQAKQRFFVFAVSIIALVGCSSAALTPEGEKVRLIRSQDDVEWCESLGEIRVGPMCCDDADVQKALRNKAAQQQATHIDYHGIDNLRGGGTASAYRCDLAKLAAADAALQAKAAERIVCIAGLDCEVRWSRAMQWIQNNSHWKFRNVTDTLMTTEGPLETRHASFEVTKIPTGDGQTYNIVLRTWCGTEMCFPSTTKLKADFVTFVTSK